MNINQLADIVQKIAVEGAEAAKRERQIHLQLGEQLTVNHALTCAIAALAETHSNRGLALKEFRRIWRLSLPASLRSTSGTSLPHVALQTLDVLAKSMGGQAFEGPEI